MTANQPWSQPAGSYIPIVKIPPTSDELQTALHMLYEQYKQGEHVGGQSAFKYVIYELTGNIYEHSEFTAGYVMAQAYPKKKFMDICFFDNGIAIPGSFKKHGILFEHDANAIIDALKGRSTKDIDRGKGLGTSMKVLTEALGGEALIVSGAGLIHLDKSKVEGYILTEMHRLKGTLISARIPFPSEKVNIYEYVE
jgi:hypothetical protein